MHPPHDACASDQPFSVTGPASRLGLVTDAQLGVRDFHTWRSVLAEVDQRYGLVRRLAQCPPSILRCSVDMPCVRLGVRGYPSR